MAAYIPHRSGTKDWRPHFVYRVFDADDQLLYVGCTVDVARRMAFHATPTTAGPTSQALTARMARVTTKRYYTKRAALTAERLAIETEAPLLNKTYNSSRFQKVRGLGYVPVAVPA